MIGSGNVAHAQPLSVMMPLQRFPTDRAYFVAKELLTTERTYLKDLEVVTVVSQALAEHRCAA